MTHCREQLAFSFHQSTTVVADFKGGLITSDAGLLAMAELDHRLGWTEAIAAHHPHAALPDRLAGGAVEPREVVDPGGHRLNGPQRDQRDYQARRATQRADWHHGPPLAACRRSNRPTAIAQSLLCGGFQV